MPVCRNPLVHRVGFAPVGDFGFDLGFLDVLALLIRSFEVSLSTATTRDNAKAYSGGKKHNRSGSNPHGRLTSTEKVLASAVLDRAMYV